MKKNNKKYLYLGVFAVVILGIVFISPLGQILQLGEAKSCDETPYLNDCSCSADQRKIDVKWIGIPKWACENVDQLILDPQSPTFQTDAIQFVKDYFGQYCGQTCTDLSCGSLCEAGNPITCQGDKYMTAAYGYDANGDRSVNVECVEVTQRDSQGRAISGTTPWRMQFLVESDTGIPYVYEGIGTALCTDPTQTYGCTYQEFCAMATQQDPQQTWCVPDLPIQIKSLPLSIFTQVQDLDTSGYDFPVP